MENHVDERDFKLLENDKYTFFVLSRVITKPCELLLTDHKRIIICYSQNPFPLWIWTADDATEEEKEKAYSLSSQNGFLDGNHSINLKYDLANYFIKRAKNEGKNFSIQKNMLVYDCLNPSAPEKITPTDGELYHCKESDLDLVTNFKEAFHNELKLDIREREAYKKDVEIMIKEGNTYLWKNSEGVFVASCYYRTQGNLASLSLVYTFPEFRRKHYAENLVYEVTKIAINKGYIPMLYTDGDYIASNACYVKVGYILRGKLCSIG